MKRLTLALGVLLLAFSLHPPRSFAQPSPTAASSAQQQPVPSAISAAAATPQQAARKVTAYTLPPDQYKKARDWSRIRLRLALISFVYGVVVLWLVLRWKLAPKYRSWAEGATRRRFVQALIFSPVLILTADVLELPTGIYDNWISREYGLSVQAWGSWSWDWLKGELISVIIGSILIWMLYGVIRWSPRFWWFYFWLVSVPFLLGVAFVQPFIIDPMFHKFEPLATRDPALTAALEQMVQRAGQNIPPERMFWMKASEKSTAVDAYVTGFGASKRIVIWDTTMAKMNTPQIVYAAGHEMGHYVLYHIPKQLAFLSAGSLLLFYLGFRLIGWMLARWGAKWDIRGIDDWASLPALMLLLSILGFLANPATNTFSRHYEHQADQYGLEVTHGLTPDSGQVAAQAFQILGEVNLSDPEPSALNVFLFYSHPSIADVPPCPENGANTSPELGCPGRIRFALTYDPWSKGGTGEFVH